MKFMIVALVSLLASLEVSIIEAVDKTQTPGASGSGVVETVANRIQASCIFDEDKLFLRRLAYVESKDGQEATTYRNGYYGGIWQVDQQMYDNTKASGNQSTIAAIDAEFGVNWMQTTWQDLRKPLHSGLAARLYIEHSSSGAEIPRSISQQADFWVNYYHPQGDKDDFTQASNALETGCQKSTEPDLVFVLDGSGSIGFENFHDVLEFVEEVVDASDIGPDRTRVAVIQYASNPTHEFDLDSYSTKEDVINAIRAITYMSGGTRTYDALDAMVNRTFQEQYGARPLSQGHPRVGIVLTDGQSSYEQTKAAAERAHAADITLLAIGVGNNVDHDELEAIASDPDCLHLFFLGFTDIASLHYAIEKTVCDAPIIVNSTVGGHEIDDAIPPGGSQNCKLVIPPGGATVKIVTHKGSTTFYVASSTYPSESYYEIKAESTPGNNGVLYFVNNETVFCNVQGGNSSQNNISIGIQPGDQDWCRSNPCKNGATCADQGSSYVCICPTGFTGSHCENTVSACTSNPCVHGKSYCTCDAGYTGPTCDQLIPVNVGYNCQAKNPCTEENITNKKFYHAHDDSSKFVQCSEWGQCFEMSCPSGLVWDPVAYTCNFP